MRFPIRPTVPSLPSGRRLAAAAATAAACAVAFAGPASAHVSVNPDTAEQGGYATIAFKVPNERDNASTVKLEVTFPAGHPLTSVMPQPVPGWDVDVTRTKLEKPLESHGRRIEEVPSKITWTETGGGIEPGTFQQFPVSVGQLPEDVDRLVFKAVQTYDNDEVVRWIEEPVEGEEEPESPAPVLELAPPADGEDGHGSAGTGDAEKAAGSAESSGDAEKAAASGESSGTTDTTARVLAVVGIAAGAGGIALGVLAGRRRPTA
ncbi:YcnI family copper-binding membrane protein [Streptomyces sp. URMC 125]|uniref:YcnI family copper-binding membrane protein n=1 Tax=Streptomyces sp. URMC 125 TaxID=3423419 RepID=UPI003F1E0631